MNITLNGNPHALPNPTPLPLLLSSLGLANKPVIVELNQSPILPRDFATTTINPGDKVEIVTLAAGG